MSKFINSQTVKDMKDKVMKNREVARQRIIDKGGAELPIITTEQLREALALIEDELNGGGRRCLDQ